MFFHQKSLLPLPVLNYHSSTATPSKLPTKFLCDELLEQEKYIFFKNHFYRTIVFDILQSTISRYTLEHGATLRDPPRFHPLVASPSACQTPELWYYSFLGKNSCSKSYYSFPGKLPTLRVITLFQEKLPTLRVTLFQEKLPTLKVISLFQEKLPTLRII